MLLKGAGEAAGLGRLRLRADAGLTLAFPALQSNSSPGRGAQHQLPHPTVTAPASCEEGDEADEQVLTAGRARYQKSPALFYADN